MVVSIISRESYITANKSTKLIAVLVKVCEGSRESYERSVVCDVIPPRVSRTEKIGTLFIFVIKIGEW